jgi:hypothetical protein
MSRAWLIFAIVLVTVVLAYVLIHASVYSGCMSPSPNLAEWPPSCHG